jgi:predicted SprT family Zn-dependent metalloprotease
MTKPRLLSEELERKMDRMSIRHEFQHILKHQEMSQLMDKDVKLFKLVKFLEKVQKMDDEERQKSSHNGRN